MRQSALLAATLLVVGLLAVWQLPILEPIAMWWELGRPPHPLLTSAEGASTQLDTTEPELLFHHTFYYGETCGQLTPFPEAVERGLALSSPLRMHFFDGLGHGLETEGADVDALLAHIESGAPPAFRGALYEGILRDLTERAQGEPEQVLPQAEAITARVGLRNPYNGVRIGLQRALGHDLPRAIATAARYPEDYWPALYEELGWRSAVPDPSKMDDGDPSTLPDGASIAAHAALVPASSRCHFLHGALRGSVIEQQGLDRSSWQSLEALVQPLDEDCRQAAYQGIAWGLFVTAAQEPTRVEWMLSQIPDIEARRVVEESYHRIASPISLRTTTVSSPGTPISPWELHKLRGDALPAR